MSVLDRIGSLRAEAEEAVQGAVSSAALEELRVRYLGRKAELPNLLRGVAQLPPEERGTVGRAANQARQALEQLIEGRAHELESTELDARLAADRIDVTLPGEPPQPVGRLPLVTQTWREIEDVFLGLGFTSVEGPEIELVHYNFDALNHDPTHPSRDHTDTFYVAPDIVLRTHTSPMQIRAMEAHPPPPDADPRDRGAPPAALRREPGTHVPPRQRRDPHAAVPPVRGPRRRRGHHARRPQGHAAELRQLDLRRGPRRAPAPALLPVHRAERRGRRVVLPLRRQGLHARRLALPAVQGRGVDRDPRRRRGRSQCLLLRRRRPLRPREGPGLRVGDGHRAHRPAQARPDRHARAVRQRPPLPRAVRLTAMRAPLDWLEQYCNPGL